jgi:hypothetical protein
MVKGGTLVEGVPRVGFAGKVSGPGYEKFGGSFKSAGGSMVS